MKKLLLLILIPFLSFGQCQDETACNFNDPISSECNFFSCYTCDYLNTLPEEYAFYRNDLNTVYFNGQTCRLQMAEDIYLALSDTEYTANQVLEMFNYGTGFPVEYDCNKNIGSRTAQSEAFPEYIKLKFDEMIEEFFSDVIINWDVEASVGVAGAVYEKNGNVKRVNNKGVEIRQVFIKGLIGAMCVDQINNKYLERVLNNEGGNDENELDELGYTEMEHDLDEAFGNLYGVWDFLNPDAMTGALLDKHLDKVNLYYPGIANAIYDAFIIARHSIVIDDFETRDFQIGVIKYLINKVVIHQAINYLLLSADMLTEDIPISETGVFHYLSKAYGFIFSLQFTDYFNTNQIENLMNEMMEGNGFWDITVSDINNIIDFIITSAGYDYYEEIAYQDLNSNSIIELCECSDDNESLFTLGGCEAAINIFNELGGCNYEYNGVLISEICPESCGECEETNLNEITIKVKSSFKTMDILGRETATNKGFQLHIYDDGTVEKKYVIK